MSCSPTSTGGAIVSHCGEGEPLPRTARDPGAWLKYPFGDFIFDNTHTFLTQALVSVPGQQKIAWVNMHIEPPDQTFADMQRASEAEAMLEGISVYESQGRQALRVLTSTPCLAGLATHY